MSIDPTVSVGAVAGGLGSTALFAHAIHLSDREIARMVETDSAIAHCPVSNMFIRSGVMPIARYLDEGLRILAEVKRQVDVPILTDVHEDTNISAVARVVDVMQTLGYSLGVEIENLHAALD